MNTRYLSDIENVNILITVPAAWLHDCVQIAKDHPARSRASRRSAEAACRFLDGLGFPPELLPDVRHAIEAHSFSAAIPPRTPEARVVQDADRLDALGAIGITRCLLTGGALGSGIYHPDDPFCKGRDPDDRAYMIDHFYAKLFSLPDTMQTGAGGAEAARRVGVMRQFLAALGEELGAAV